VIVPNDHGTSNFADGRECGCRGCLRSIVPGTKYNEVRSYVVGCGSGVEARKVVNR
jgi:hypothetical protein